MLKLISSNLLFNEQLLSIFNYTNKLKMTKKCILFYFLTSNNLQFILNIFIHEYTFNFEIIFQKLIL